jgi:hypothetical protein
MKLAAVAPVVVALLRAEDSAAADPLRLRADALATTNSPAGLLVLEADGPVKGDVDAEAVVWMAGVHELGDSTGDVLVAVVHGRTANNRAAGQLGRFVSSLGATRPTHVDGGQLRLRLPKRFDLELVAGIPVLPAGDSTEPLDGRMTTARAWDWYAGARASRRLGEWGAIGVALAERRDDHEVVSQELGLDAGFTLGKRDDLGARLAYDLANPGVAEATVTASHRMGTLRTDLYASERAASHLLPATSLFSVLGDVPSERAGVLATWRAAPRLDLIADVGARYVDEVGAELTGRARLRLDERGTSALTGEVRRSGVGEDAWTGLRGAARIGLSKQLTLATELELVIRDRESTTSISRGTVWPWGLVALSCDRGAWSAAIAGEASSTPEYARRFDVLGQLSRRWGR